MPDYALLLREALCQGNPVDVVLAALLEQGASKVETTKAIHDVMGLRLMEAKKLVENAADKYRPNQ